MHNVGEVSSGAADEERLAPRVGHLAFGRFGSSWKVQSTDLSPCKDFSIVLRSAHKLSCSLHRLSSHNGFVYSWAGVVLPVPLVQFV